ncbi:anthranilate synthase/aminodeoxychorismate synthase-like glutamine amidotransferase [Lysinibacillus composti]|uniref:Aminodeoxychorismate/anthranilate synthase component II n=1 Tax=Lysinibacillus composti TaxID=720633 RepID=A0A3N9UA47_9BACI|nr:aminodeoxychorismate/anthranilate synthase component II [Lysinibacillus composti]MBM7607514.1 anthranilate synthase/aminodeoxychorismate synthase-like glutamine amidotransferase [Lysinibacillus composti]RQW73341.1 aminodeoxychorismate/anthranilate synthase component II [Lysinibacillus composti]
MILLIDNYDSFTYNLVQYIRNIGEELVVFRNDQITLEQISEINPDYIVLSPGPGNPSTAGICLKLVERFYQEIPIFGVCLGQQIIAEAFGGIVKKAKQPMHGKTSMITHDKRSVFDGLPSPLKVTRYHSLVVDEATLPSCLVVTARTEDGEIMALRHSDYPVEGVQFHPESIMTENGLQMMRNFFQNTIVKER